MKLTINATEGPIQKAHTLALVDRSGSGVFASQVAIDGTLTVNYDVLGRTDPSMPWVAMKSGQTAGFLESVAFVPFFALKINSISGTGNIHLFVSEN